jgi:hypothetical protein
MNEVNYFYKILAQLANGKIVGPNICGVPGSNPGSSICVCEFHVVFTILSTDKKEEIRYDY